MTTLEPAPIVFVVDDDESVREALASLVRSAGMRVEVFASAQAFLSRPPVDAPGCLILDVRLQGSSGLDLQRRLPFGAYLALGAWLVWIFGPLTVV